MYSLVVLCVLAVSVYGDIDPHHTICKTFECLPYDVIQTKATYEIRKYHDMTAAVVYQYGMRYPDAMKANYAKLIRYRDGGNSLHKKIPMVYPILNLFQMNDKEVPIKGFYSMGFFTPKALHDQPPQGTIAADGVMINHYVGDNIVYVSSFQGAPPFSHVLALQRKLHDDLVADGVKFSHSLFYMAQYHDPSAAPADMHTDMFYV